MFYRIRKIKAKDNAAVEGIIRSCLKEFGADHEGTAWEDPDLGRFSELYQAPASCYYVVEDENGEIVGGAGIGRLTEDTCELQKMYFLEQARGTGISHRLMKIVLNFARQHYKKVYLETLSNMIAAQRFYLKHGFYQVYEPVGNTGHYACDVLYMKDLV